MTLVAFEGVAVGTVMPAVGLDLDGLGIYAWAFNAYVVTSLVGMVVAGTWCDRDGPRKPLVGGMFVFALGAVLSGFAPTMAMLIAARGLQGLGGGAIIVGIYVLIARAYDEHLRPRAFSLLAASWVIPGLVGPVIAGSLTDAFTWRLVFWLVPLVLVLPLLLLRGVLAAHEGGTGETGRSTRIVPAILAAVGLTLVMFGLLRPSGTAFVVAAVSVLLGAALLIPAATRLLPPGALTLRRGLPTTIIMRGVLSAGFFAAETFIPLALVEQRGLSVTVAGAMLSISALGWLTGSFLQSRLPGSADRSRTVQWGALVAAISVATLPLCLLPGMPLAVGAASFLVASIGMGLSFPSIAVQTIRLSPEEQQGANSSALQISDAIFSSVGLCVAGAIHAAAVQSGGATVATYDVIWWLCAAVLLVGAGIAARMRPNSRVPSLPTP